MTVTPGVGPTMLDEQPYWASTPRKRTRERIARLAAVVDEHGESLTVQALTYKLYPDAHGQDLTNAYNKTVKDAVRARGGRRPRPLGVDQRSARRVQRPVARPHRPRELPRRSPRRRPDRSRLPCRSIARSHRANRSMVREGDGRRRLRERVPPARRIEIRSRSN